MLFLILFAIVVLLVYLRVVKSMNYWKDRNVPYIKPLPILGNSASLLFRTRSFMEQVQDVYNAYPNKRYYGIHAFMTPQFLIRDPELIKQITIKDFDHFTDRTTFVREDAEPIFTKNLAGLKGQTWRDMRSTLSPSFTSSKMKFLFTLISDVAEQFVNYFEEPGSEVAEIEMKDVFCRFANDTIASAAFGVTVNSMIDKQNEFFLTGKDVTNFSGFRMLRFIGYSIFPSLMRLLRIPLFSPGVSEFFRRIVKETIQVREENGVVRPDMIHILLEANKGRINHDEDVHEDDGFAVVDELPSIKGETHHKSILSQDDITAQALIFFFAGFETTSTVMSFLAYELALNRDIQSRLQEEIDETVGSQNGKITYENVLGMKYLDMVVSEALRKWSPGIALDRVCVKDYLISPQLPEESPVTIEKGTSVNIPVSGIHLDPKYFPDPTKFNPERFSDENKPYIDAFTYMPFGAGPRNCIASRFALMQTKTLFFHLLWKCDLVPIKRTLIPMVTSKKNFSLIPDDGLWLGIKPRSK